MYQSDTGFKSTDQKKFYNKNKIQEYIIDETAIKTGSELIWLWVVIEPENKQILSFHISKEQNMFVAERFLSHVLDVWKTSSFI